MTNGLAMVNYYNCMFFSKIEDTSPNWSGPHYHEFENGVCRCWFVNSDHVHIYDNGVCACKDVTSEHIHDYNEEGICACKATNDKHSHNFNSDMCNCGAYYNDVVG